jgi:pimeloyl-ACP methyl ester carboxylesterase
MFMRVEQHSGKGWAPGTAVIAANGGPVASCRLLWASDQAQQRAGQNWPSARSRPGGRMRISLGDVSLWFDLSGPSVVPQGDTTVERPVLVAVHGGPGLDHMTVKPALEPLAGDFQVLYFDLRGHGRSDRSSAASWNMRTWADDLRRLCDALGLRKPVVLGSSFGGDVADAEDLQAEFTRVCYPLYSATPGWAEESHRFLARMIRNPDVAAHYDSHEISSFDPWSLLGAVRCPVLILAGEDDPVCPLPVVEELASQLPEGTTRFVRLPGARHTIFRDRPDLAFPPVKDFVSQISESQPAS